MTGNCKTALQPPARTSSSPASTASSRVPASSADLVRKIIIKRQLDLVIAAHRALATQLSEDKQFAKRYPTLDRRSCLPSTIAPTET